MYEKFKFAADRTADFPDLFERQLPLKYKSGESEPFIENGVFRSPYGALCGCVERNPDAFFGRNGDYGKVLDNDGIGAGVFYFMHQASCPVCFPVVEDCVESNEYSCPISVGISAERGDVPDVIPGGLSGPERRTRNIYGIGTAVDCRNADVTISCGSKKLRLSSL